jgi:acetyl-CoA carboxylase carboxyltransferase component
MGPKGAIEVLHAKELKQIEDKEEREKVLAEREEEYRKKFANPYVAAKYGYIDDVIEPRNSRFRIIRALRMLSTKKDMNPPKKHSNIPL